MKTEYSIKGFDISASDEKAVRTAKFDYIDSLNFSGCYYRSIRVLSGMFNEIFDLFNSNNEKTFELNENHEISSFDTPKFISFSEKFFSDLKNSNVSDETFNFFKNFVHEYIETLDKHSNAIRNERAKMTA